MVIVRRNLRARQGVTADRWDLALHPSDNLHPDRKVDGRGRTTTSPTQVRVVQEAGLLQEHLGRVAGAGLLQEHLGRVAGAMGYADAQNQMPVVRPVVRMTGIPQDARHGVAAKDRAQGYTQGYSQGCGQDYGQGMLRVLVKVLVKCTVRVAVRVWLGLNSPSLLFCGTHGTPGPTATQAASEFRPA